MNNGYSIFILKITQWILIKFGIAGINYKLLSKFHFDLYRNDLILYKVQINFIGFLENMSSYKQMIHDKKYRAHEHQQ